MGEGKKSTASGKSSKSRGWRKNLHLLPVALLALFISCLLFIWHFSVVSTTETLPLKVTVNRTGYDYGIAISSTELNFGEMPIGGVSRKFIIIRNSGDHLAFVRFEISGNISDMVRVNRNNLLLSPDQKTEIDVLLNATRFGSYSGMLVITKLQAKNMLGDIYLRRVYSRVAD